MFVFAYRLGNLKIVLANTKVEMWLSHVIPGLCLSQTPYVDYFISSAPAPTAEGHSTRRASKRGSGTFNFWNSALQLEDFVIRLWGSQSDTLQRNCIQGVRSKPIYQPCEDCHPLNTVYDSHGGKGSKSHTCGMWQPAECEVLRLSLQLQPRSLCNLCTVSVIFIQQSISYSTALGQWPQTHPPLALLRGPFGKWPLSFLKVLGWKVGKHWGSYRLTF